MDINLEYYKIFYYVAGSQSITLAAEQLTISQPAVSQAVKHLEQALSCPLFVRTTKGVRLTKEGEMLYSYVQRGYETILSGERKLSEMLNLEQGEICIGASDMTLKYFLLPYLETDNWYPMALEEVSAEEIVRAVDGLLQGTFILGQDVA